MKELWRSIAGYEGWYEVSNFGRIRRMKPGYGTRVGLIRVPGIGARGRLNIILCKNDVRRVFTIHSLVARAFIGKCPPGKQINHKDYNYTNNRVDNLEYVTPSENMRHAYAHGKKPTQLGERQHKAKLTEKAVIDIRIGGLTDRQFAERYGVCREAVTAVRNRRSWKHIYP